MEGFDISVCRITDAGEANGGIVHVKTTAFSGAAVDLTVLDDEKNLELSTALDAYATANNIVRSFQATDNNGRAAFDGLPAGIYLVAQAGSKSSIVIAPFLVFVPTLNETQGGWNYEAITYPKVGYVKPGNKPDANPDTDPDPDTGPGTGPGTNTNDPESLDELPEPYPTDRPIDPPKPEDRGDSEPDPGDRPPDSSKPQGPSDAEPHPGGRPPGVPRTEDTENTQLWIILIIVNLGLFIACLVGLVGKHRWRSRL